MQKANTPTTSNLQAAVNAKGEDSNNIQSQAVVNAKCEEAVVNAKGEESWHLATIAT